ncbi:MAG: toluene monooxygenase [Rugosibacter sp.]|nr:MAG: toluene monooxygenase [Rugosibacter sp.]
MSEIEVLKPLKTWSHLAKRRRKPSEYEIVSVNILYNTRKGCAPYDMDPEVAMNRWYKQYRDASPLQHDDWNAFRDPDELVYRTYNMLQDGQETYIHGLFNQFNEREHDKALDSKWAGTLARLYTPTRYLFHTVQMASAYIQQMSPASTITNCAAFQTADSLRWLSHTAYRTKELSLTFADKGFGVDECTYWETDPAWQGFRELMEKLLIAWDWGEAFVALNLVAKPAIEEAVLRKLGEAARHNGDTLLGMLTDNQLMDAVRHRRWATALVKMILEKEGNAAAIKQWIAKWEPLADKAIDAFCAATPEVPDAAHDAKQATRDFRLSLAL